VSAAVQAVPLRHMSLLLFLLKSMFSGHFYMRAGTAGTAEGPTEGAELVP
jgi:hypothetical protein